MVLAVAASADADRLPLGDGQISSEPRRDHVYSCQTRFHGGGAHRSGAWLGATSWDPKAKPVVDGRVAWPDAAITISREGRHRIIRANNLPTHTTGRFPISASDDAYRFDRNPNAISGQNILLTLPAEPEIADRARCVPMGMIGFALSGVAIFNALDAMGRDAPAYEIQDACQGHPERSGQYHYHDYSRCLADARSQPGGHSNLVGYALDGFGIYGLYGRQGVPVTNDDLDDCHGHRHALSQDGAHGPRYHYHMTREYPYSIGCFRGEPVRVANARGPGQPAGGAGRGQPPPRDREIIERAARELGVSPNALREAVGPPPPDFSRASRMLNLDAESIRRAMDRARREADG